MADVSCFAMKAGGGGGGRGRFWQGSLGGGRGGAGAPLCAVRAFGGFGTLDSCSPGFVDFSTDRSIWMEPLRPGGPVWSPSPPSPATLYKHGN